MLLFQSFNVVEEPDLLQNMFFIDICSFCQGPAWRMLQWVRRGSGGFRNCLTSPVLKLQLRVRLSALRKASKAASGVGCAFVRMASQGHQVNDVFGHWWWKSWREIRNIWMKAKIYSGSISKQCWDIQTCSLKGSRKEMSMNCPFFFLLSSAVIFVHAEVESFKGSR